MFRKMKKSEKFPINLSSYKHLNFDFKQRSLSRSDLKQLQQNINLVRDSIVFFTAYAGAKGLGGHTGGAYDIVPEVLIFDAFMRGNKGKIVPILFDAAGHRVAIQYMLAALDKQEKGFPIEKLLHYRERGHGAYGHPERDEKLGIKFSSGRLGHLWPYVNGVAVANPGKKVVLFTSDGSLQEGDADEAARFAVAQQLGVVVSVDDNNVTISGYPKEYMPGFDVRKTLLGHGLAVDQANPEHLPSLYKRIREALISNSGPIALVQRRKMAVSLHGLEGKAKAHDVVSKDIAIMYLSSKGHIAAADMLRAVKKEKVTLEFLGSSGELKKNRSEFGNAVNAVLSKMSKRERLMKVRVFDSDLGGSTGLSKVGEKYPECFVQAGIMERHNFSAAAGFGMEAGHVGVMSTFSAFLEMIISELSMARLNKSNVLAHFSHAGVDWMADSNCHYGVNNFFADNAFWEEGSKKEGATRLYFPCDAYHLQELVKAVFWDKGIRFVFSTRSPTPQILDSKGKPFYKGRKFVAGKDDIIRGGKHGVIVSYGEMLCRAVHVSEKLRGFGYEVAVVNKSTLNVVDEKMMAKLEKMPFVFVLESQNEKTGLGMRFGTWLLERGFLGSYAHIGVNKLGRGGLSEHLAEQGLDALSVEKKVMRLLKLTGARARRRKLKRGKKKK